MAEIPEELTDREAAGAARGSRASGPGATSWSAPAGRRAAARARAAGAAAFRLGDDVVHAAFGDGVVTGVEPGGIVVIRFSKDRSERKLVADLAPISKR